MCDAEDEPTDRLHLGGLDQPLSHFQTLGRRECALRAVIIGFDDRKLRHDRIHELVETSPGDIANAKDPS
jgi:hypothetical protein